MTWKIFFKEIQNVANQKETLFYTKIRSVAQWLPKKDMSRLIFILNRVRRHFFAFSFRKTYKRKYLKTAKNCRKHTSFEVF